MSGSPKKLKFLSPWDFMTYKQARRFLGSVFQGVRRVKYLPDSATFKFQCQECGTCCRDIERVSRITITAAEAFSMAKFANCHEKAFSIDPSTTLATEGAQGGDQRCILLDEQDHCRSHPVKPLSCAIYPVQCLADPTTGKLVLYLEEGGDCPGLGQGGNCGLQAWLHQANFWWRLNEIKRLRTLAEQVGGDSIVELIVNELMALTRRQVIGKFWTDDLRGLVETILDIKADLEEHGAVTEETRAAVAPPPERPRLPGRPPKPKPQVLKSTPPTVTEEQLTQALSKVPEEGVKQKGVGNVLSKLRTIREAGDEAAP